MSKTPVRISFTILCLLALLFLPVIGNTEDKVIEGYTASLVNMQGAGPGPTQIKMLIYSFTPEADVPKLAEALKTGGNDGLVNVLEKSRIGRVAPTGGLGTDLNLIRSFETDKGRIIRMVSTRPMSFLELRHAGRSTDYPFSVIELLIDKEGKIEGTAIAAIKLKFGENNILEVESLGTQSLRLMSIKKIEE